MRFCGDLTHAGILRLFIFDGKDIGIMRTKSNSRQLRSSVARGLRTANAVRPFARHGHLSVPSFFDGWLRSELPLHVAAAHSIASLRAVRHGALKSGAGVAAVAINTAASLRLIKIFRDAQGATDIFRTAMSDEFGANFMHHIDPSLRTQYQPLGWKRTVQPFPTARRMMCADTNISYGERGRRNRLDVWKSRDLPLNGTAPVLLQIHGGAWMVGNKEEQGQPLMSHLTERGWVCVAINYGLSPRSTWPDHIVDVKRAIAWIKEHIHAYGGDPNFIAVTGGSAGGHLSALAALTANDPRYQPGFESVDTTVQAAVPMYGVFDFTNRDGSSRSDMQKMLEDRVFKTKFGTDGDNWNAASPMSRVHEDAPPFMVVHGTNDSLAPIEQARSFVDLLRKESTNSVIFVELPGTQHAFDVFWSPRTHAAVHSIEQFLGIVRSDKMRSSAAQLVESE